MKSFGYAMAGIVRALREERHMRIHLCCAFYVVCCGVAAELDAASWAAVICCIGLVTSLELVNTALERVCNEVTMKTRPNIGAAKDCAAGAVLCAAVCSAAAGLIIFLSNGRVRTMLSFAENHKPAAAVIVLVMPLWIYYIIKPGRSYK